MVILLNLSLKGNLRKILRESGDGSRDFSEAFKVLGESPAKDSFKIFSYLSESPEKADLSLSLQQCDGPQQRQQQQQRRSSGGRFSLNVTLVDAAATTVTLELVVDDWSLDERQTSTRSNSFLELGL